MEFSYGTVRSTGSGRPSQNYCDFFSIIDLDQRGELKIKGYR